MKIVSSICIALILCQMAVGHSWAQKGNPGNEANPHTILWKITGANCPRPSYLLGTFHLSDAEWLLKTPQFGKVVDSTEYILNEQFTTQPLPATPKRNILKALPLLDRTQFETLDSFFIARVGEGIRNNPDAEAMTVAEMESAIMVTLVSGNDKANAVTKFMDKDLFELYVKLGRHGDRLDRVKVTDFDSSEIGHARQYLTRAVSYTIGSDKPDWNIYGTPSVEDTLAHYKTMNFEYHLEEYSARTVSAPYFDFIPLAQRNKDWMPKIISAISSRPTLIAVGLAHLYYKTGVIMLLRAEGYRVEPVMFD
ncbi:MAG TPA: TraB/GumN family protein [Dyadobacter sp.]|nr:TraB/GumN family protein [Dyadobacter sp.]